MAAEERPLLAAIVGPFAAVVIDRELGPDLRRKAAALMALGQDEAARQLSLAADQVREAARQLLERTSVSGTAELPQTVESAESECPPRPIEWWPTGVVAEKLGVSERQVRNLAKQPGRLSATTLGGRTLIDPLSVVEEMRRRRELQRRRGDD